MDVDIQELRKKKFTIEQIADHLGLTVGQVKYRLYKKNDVAHAVQEKQEVPTSTREKPSLPLYYGDQEIVLMVQGPTVLFTYWELTWPLVALVSDCLGMSFEHLTKVIRIYDITDIWFDGTNEHGYREISFREGTDNWFFHDMAPNRTYIAELGVLRDSCYIALLRSKPKATPNNQPAAEFSPYVEVIPSIPKERTKPKWFENFSTYTIY